MSDSLEKLLRKLLAKKFKFYPRNNEGKFILQDPDSKKRYEFVELPSGAFAVGGYGNQNWAFEQSKKGDKEEPKPYGRACDYLIFIPQKGGFKVVFCELKSGVGSSDIRRGGTQIVATIPLLQYLLSAVETHFGKKWKISERYALVGTWSKGDGFEKEEMLIREQHGGKSFLQKKNKHSKIKVNFILGADSVPISAIT